MYPKTFEYIRARDVEEALSILRSNHEAKIIAGGQSLVPMMKLRVVSPAKLVDISKLKLRYINEDQSGAGKLRIGALTTHADLVESEVVKNKIPLLSSTAENIGDTQIRELGTVGGSICHADPSADYFPTLLVLGASIVARSSDENRRIIPISEFAIAPFETTLRENELMEELVVPMYSGVGGVVKLARRKADFALVSAAAILDRDQATGRVRDFRLAIGPQEETATRLHQVEQDIKNKRFDSFSELDKQIRLSIAKEKFKFPSDLHGSSWYRLEVLESIIIRLVGQLYEKKESSGATFK